MTETQKAVPPHRLLLVTFNFLSAAPALTQLEEYFNNSTDWYRYAPNCWLLWTSGTPDSWFTYLQSHMDGGDHVVVVMVDLNAGLVGRLPSGAWEWMRRYLKLRSDTQAPA